MSKPVDDYGVDQVIKIFDGKNASHYELHVQLKSSDNSTEGDHERAQVRVSTYNLLKSILHVTMFIKYVHPDHESYWIYTLDMAEPNQTNETFTVSIPKANRLSQIDWSSRSQNNRNRRP
ncbi:MAG: DUF4365 domain-containing protein [Chryseobacterium sp.]|nr:MAG: DUF4365 domain-containing protein [Chryseobacterium sp.]